MSKLVLVAATIAGLAVALSTSTLAAPPGWEALLSGNATGSRQLVIEGRLIGEDGRPMRNVRLHAYHAGEHGQYTAPGSTEYLHEGLLRTNVLGEFRVRTGLPGMAEEGPHVHFDVELPGGKYRMIALALARKAGAGSDALYGKLPWMVNLKDPDRWAYVEPSDPKTYRCAWDLHVARAAVVPKPKAFAVP